MRFDCFSLDQVQRDPALLYTLGQGVLPQIAEAFGFELPESPTSDVLRELTTQVAPRKTLRDNMDYAKEVLGDDAHTRCADWLKRSGAMQPVLGGAFIDPTVAAPRQFHTLVFSGGTANWMLRRAALAQQVDPKATGQVLLPMGTRVMAAGEHQLVRTYKEEFGQLPTEADFTERFIEPALAAVGFKSTQLIPVESGHANEILARLFAKHPELLEYEHQTLVIGNAPNALQAAGQLRLAGLECDKSYDYRGSQLFYRSDCFPIALSNEPAAEAQNPISGLGQILRNFKVLLDNVKAAEVD